MFLEHFYKRFCKLQSANAADAARVRQLRALRRYSQQEPLSPRMAAAVQARSGPEGSLAWPWPAPLLAQDAQAVELDETLPLHPTTPVQGLCSSQAQLRTPPDVPQGMPEQAASSSRAAPKVLTAPHRHSLHSAPPRPCQSQDASLGPVGSTGTVSGALSHAPPKASPHELVTGALSNVDIRTSPGKRACTDGGGANSVTLPPGQCKWQTPQQNLSKREVGALETANEADARRIQQPSRLRHEKRRSRLTSHAAVAAQPGAAPDIPGPERPLALPLPPPLLPWVLQGADVDGALPAAIPQSSAQNRSGQVSPTSSSATEVGQYPSTEQRHAALDVLWSRREVVCSQPTDVPHQMLHSTPPWPCQSLDATSGVLSGVAATNGVPWDASPGTSSRATSPSSPKSTLRVTAKPEASRELTTYTTLASLHPGSSSTTVSEESDRSSEAGAPPAAPLRRPSGEVTLVLRRLPSGFSQERFLRQWPPNGSYDFLCRPYSLKQRRPASYAFLNLTSEAAAARFAELWRQHGLLGSETGQPGKVGLASVQGLRANVLHHRRLARLKPACHPVVFSGTVRLDFEEVLRQLDAGYMDSPLSDGIGKP